MADTPRRFDSMPALDEPWRRLPWVIPMALCIWTAVLFTFSVVLRQPRATLPATVPLDAQLIELPPPKPVVEGLAGSSRTASPPVVRLHPRPRLIVRRSPAPIKRVRVRPHETAASAQVRRAPKAKPTVVSSAPPAPSASGRSPALGEGAPASRGGSGGMAAPGETSLGGIGSAVGGARAIYSPMPTLPDYLRQNPLDTVAVARFEVDAAGKPQVTLIQPTSDPRLNYLILAKLREWRFFPAVKDGKPVASVFSVRIPIVVR